MQHQFAFDNQDDNISNSFSYNMLAVWIVKSDSKVVDLSVNVRRNVKCYFMRYFLHAILIQIRDKNSHSPFIWTELPLHLIFKFYFC